KYGEAANLPTSAMKKRGGSRGGAASLSPRASASSPSPRLRGEGRGEGQPAGGASVPSPLAGERQEGGAASRAISKIHKPHLDALTGPESLPYRPTRSLPEKPFGGTSKIIQPTNSRDSGPEFGPAPRSTGGAPGKRGGWKRR